MNDPDDSWHAQTSVETDVHGCTRCKRLKDQLETYRLALLGWQAQVKWLQGERERLLKEQGGKD